MESTNYLHVFPSAFMESGSIVQLAHRSLQILGLVLWKQLQVCDSRGSRWKYEGHMEAHGSFHGIFKLQLIPRTVETFMYFHGCFQSLSCTAKLPRTSVEAKQLLPTSMEPSMEVN